MFRYFFLFLCFIYSLSVNAELKGDWVVSKVYVNLESTVTPQIIFNDPIYRYRIIQISEKDIKSNLYSFPKITICSDYTTSQSSIKFDDILNELMAKSINQILTPESFGIKIDQKINQIKLSCSNSKDEWTLFQKNKDDYLLINDPFSILEINKVTPDQISASFICERAQKTSEKIICQNIYLSGLDKSIHDIYYQIKNNIDSDSFGRIYNQQRKFLRKRDLCDNEVCLNETMSDQLIFLEDQMPKITP